MNTRSLLLFAGVIVAAVAAWFFVSPLFVDRTVDEPFALTELPTRTEIRAMDPPARSALMRDLMSAANNAPASAMHEAMPMKSVPEPLAVGTFSDADAIHKGTGTATLYPLPDGGHLVRFEDFRVTNGPALVVLLTKHPDPRSASEVTSAGYVKLGKLKGNVGSQNYPVAAQVEMNDYNTVVIWCELFDVLFSPAPLKRF